MLVPDGLVRVSENLIMILHTTVLVYAEWRAHTHKKNIPCAAVLHVETPVERKVRGE